jgi:hypothetical protein
VQGALGRREGVDSLPALRRMATSGLFLFGRFPRWVSSRIFDGYTRGFALCVRIGEPWSFSSKFAWISFIALGEFLIHVNKFRDYDTHFTIENGRDPANCYSGTRLLCVYESSVADPHQFVADADPDPACYFDADPDPNPTFLFDAVPDSSLQIKAQNLEKVLK